MCPAFLLLSASESRDSEAGVSSLERDIEVILSDFTNPPVYQNVKYNLDRDWKVLKAAAENSVDDYDDDRSLSFANHVAIEKYGGSDVALAGE